MSTRQRRHAVAVAEDTAVLDRPAATRVAIVETPTIVGTAATKPGRLLIQLIKAGWSGNGRFYSEAVLKRDGPTTFPAGTLSFVDHDTDEQAQERPSGTLTRLASVMTQPAYYDPARKALMAEVRVFAPWREAVLDWASSGAIGMSIRAYAEGEDGKADGKEGWIVSALTEGRSVDYVTKPAAGGAIVAVLEAIGHPQSVAEARNVGAWLESRLHLTLTQLGDDMYGQGRLSREERIVLSAAMGDALKAWTGRVEADAPKLFERDLYDEPGATERPTNEVQETAPSAPAPPERGRQVSEAPTDEVRTALQSAVKAAYGGGKDVYAWVRDFDPDRSVVFFDVDREGRNNTWQQSYAIDADGLAQLSGEMVQVVARTAYDPVTGGNAAEALTTPVPPTTEAVTEDAPDADPSTTEPPPAEPAEPPADPPPGTENAGPASTEEGQEMPPDNPGAQPPTPGTARQVIEAEVAEMRRKMALMEARESARAVLSTALSDGWIQPATVNRITESLMARLPITAGVLDETELTKMAARELALAEQEAAEVLTAAGMGRVKDLGQSYGSGAAGLGAADVERRLEEAFRGLGNSEQVAKVAAKGRD